MRVKSDDVRFGSETDISACVRDVRYTPKSGHSAEHGGPPLIAKSRQGARRSLSVSDVNLFGYGQRIVHLNTDVAHGALDL
jgi:hypothetical protein